MENDKHYLRILSTSDFTIVVEGINPILQSDIPIKSEDFMKYIDSMSTTRYRLKSSPTGQELFDYLEEYTPEPGPYIPTETELLKAEVLEQSEYMVEMDYRLMNLELGL